MAYFEAEDGARLFYLDEGEGLPVLCLAGLTRTVEDFDYVAPHLPDIRLIRMDYRGRGRSAWTGGKSYNVPQEARDAARLLDHLGVERAAILGTSRGGLIGLFMAAVMRDRMLGLCLNDVGPEIAREGLERIFQYLGRNPSATSFEEVAKALANANTGFSDVPEGRWLEDARRHFTSEGGRIVNNYDPALREAFISAFEGESPDLWPLWDATAGMPLALIRGAESDLLSREVADEMARRRPDLIFADVPGRGHIPWLDEPESLAVLQSWLDACKAAQR
ncbi:MAG: alpha/beta hydrolase [Paracoccus sp. (in: a-proteobacteria)]|nr:alpha/beta hydrolase [Paracoccus sp. (in: a-proteobacteria)]